MEVAGLVLAVVGVVHPLIEGVAIIRRYCSDFKGSQKDWTRHKNQLDLFVIELGTLKRESIVRAIVEAYRNTPDPSPEVVLLAGLDSIKHDVDELTGMINSRPTTNPRAHLRMTFIRPKLELLATRVEAWMKHYSMMVVIALQLRMSPSENTPATNEPTENTIIAKLSAIHEAAVSELNDSSTITRLLISRQAVQSVADSAPIYVAPKPGSNDYGPTVIEYKPYSKDDAVSVRKFVVSFAQRLREVDPSTMHVLKATGVAEGKDQWELHFSYPANTAECDPRTLRSMLLTKPRHSLDQRITLVKQIATGIFYLHAAQFVHKNIRPETVLLFYNAERYPDRVADYKRKERVVIGDAFITGFLELRHEDAQTARVGENVPERNIYRHPKRQGIQLQTRYHILHDIYSFGTLLVEIAMWDNLRSLVDKSHGTIPIHKELKDTKGNPKSPLDIKAWFEKVAVEHVPRFMGQTYADLASDCLRCVDDYEAFLEKEKEGQGDSDDTLILGMPAAKVKDKNGILILHQFSRSVLERLEKINL